MYRAWAALAAAAALLGRHGGAQSACAAGDEWCEDDGDGPPPAATHGARRAARAPGRGARLQARSRDARSDDVPCTGGWDCGSLPEAVEEDVCDVATRRPCAGLTAEQLHEIANLLGEHDTAVLLEGCDEMPEFARLSRALEKAKLLEGYGDVKTRLAHNIAGVWGPGNGPTNYTIPLSEYVEDMAGFLPHHAFNAYDHAPNAGTTIMREEGFIINTTGDGAAAAAAAAPFHPTVELLGQFKQSILSLSPIGAGMPFHQHMASWLYLAHGRKFWLLSDNSASPPPELLWNDLSDVLHQWPQDMSLPSGAKGELPPVRRCLQPPGTILLLPKFWWHATSNVDDCVGVGGHMHPSMDDISYERWVDRNFKIAQVWRDEGKGIRGIDEAYLEERPFVGQVVMQAAKKRYQQGDIKGMVGMMDDLTKNVLAVYRKGELAQDKLDAFINNDLTRPMVTEVYRMNAAVPDAPPAKGAAMAKGVRLLQRYIMRIWKEVRAPSALRMRPQIALTDGRLRTRPPDLGDRSGLRRAGVPRCVPSAEPSSHLGRFSARACYRCIAARDFQAVGAVHAKRCGGAGRGATGRQG